MAGHKGHHGGAWKVAYADFVTAMMALFLVLWLTAQDERIKEAVERAFRNPFHSVTKESPGILPNPENQAVKSTHGMHEAASAVELAMLRRINEDLAKALQRQEDEVPDKTIKLDLSPDGLRISVFDRARRPIFEANSTQFTEYGAWVFTTLAWEISRYTNFVVELEGHTERGARPLRPDYGDWEISSDRANAARRHLTVHGVAAEQVRKVAGYADTMPMENAPAADEINRRVTVLLRVGSASRG